MLWRFYVIITILVRRFAIHPSHTPLARSNAVGASTLRSPIRTSKARSP